MSHTHAYLYNFYFILLIFSFRKTNTAHMIGVNYYIIYIKKNSQDTVSRFIFIDMSEDIPALACEEWMGSHTQ